MVDNYIQMFLTIITAAFFSVMLSLDGVRDDWNANGIPQTGPHQEMTSH